MTIRVGPWYGARCRHIHVRYGARRRHRYGHTQKHTHAAESTAKDRCSVHFGPGVRLKVFDFASGALQPSRCDIKWKQLTNSRAHRSPALVRPLEPRSSIA
eukprot:57699-Rhodomonas_salina.3